MNKYKHILFAAGALIVINLIIFACFTSTVFITLGTFKILLSFLQGISIGMVWLYIKNRNDSTETKKDLINFITKLIPLILLVGIIISILFFTTKADMYIYILSCASLVLGYFVVIKSDCFFYNKEKWEEIFIKNKKKVLQVAIASIFMLQVAGVMMIVVEYRLFISNSKEFIPDSDINISKLLKKSKVLVNSYKTDKSAFIPKNFFENIVKNYKPVKTKIINYRNYIGIDLILQELPYCFGIIVIVDKKNQEAKVSKFKYKKIVRKVNDKIFLYVAEY